MRCNVLFIALTFLGMASLPTAAQVKLDMNQITCEDWLGYDPETKDFVRYFMSGYYNAAANNNVLDLGRLQRNYAKVLAYCKMNKSHTLPTAIQKVTS
jgi:acid stress chaperone HdeB